MKFLFICITILYIGILEAYCSDIELPPVIEGNKQLSSIQKIFIKKFLLVGNTVFSDKQLRPLIQSYENRFISHEELQDVKNILTQYYIQQGYINSGVVIPDQEVKYDKIRLEITEGKIDRIYVNGLKLLRPNYVINRIKLSTDDGKLPLNVNRLQERLQIIKQDPLIKNVNAELKRGLNRGFADLYVQVIENKPYSLQVKFNNYTSPGVSANTGVLEAKLLNVSGWGDSISTELTKTKGLESYSGEYILPFNRWGTTLLLGFDKTVSDIVSKPFNELDIYGISRNYYGYVRHPFYKTLSTEFAMGLKLEKRYSKTHLFNKPFSFSPGVEDGESKVSVLRFWQEWVDRSMSQVIAFRSTFSFGLNILDSTHHINEALNGPDGEFIAWLSQFQWVRMLPKLNSQLLLSLSGQLSIDKLLPLEKFAIGGSSTVRGYRENFVTADNGFLGSLEWRVPITQWIIPNIRKNSDKFDIKLATFFDYGTTWNTMTTIRPIPDSLCSIGLGLRCLLFKKVEADINWGYGLRDIEIPTDSDLQDKGIHFQIKTMLF
ncbi:MAG: ShlB/FhaC/HecB family hemolysin secretion/activation protein [Desulfobacterales bacterium]|nr:ShlB/FhaC/HecB family hemolysin secretion/activation protein [Desulfobacterales bacterium]